MEKNFNSLLSAVCAIKLEWNRVSDIAMGNEIYQVVFVDYKDKTTNATKVAINLRDNKHKDYGLSEYSLAALRCCESKPTSEWLDEFGNTDGEVRFRDIALDMLEQGKDLEQVRFEVIGQLKIKNLFVNEENTPVYQDRCYSGIRDYDKAIRALLDGKPREYYVDPEFFRKKRDLRETLYQTPLTKGKDIEANIVKIPVFKVKR